MCSCDLSVCRTGEKEIVNNWHQRDRRATCWQLKSWSRYHAPALSWETRRGWGSGPRRWCSDPRKPKGKQTKGVRSCPQLLTSVQLNKRLIVKDTGSGLCRSRSSLVFLKLKKYRFPHFYIQMTGLSPDNITLLQRPKYICTYMWTNIQSVHIQKWFISFFLFFKES